MFTETTEVLLCVHSHPSDEKDHSLFSRNISGANMAALMDRHNGQLESSVTQPLMHHGDADGEKSEVDRPRPRVRVNLQCPTK